MLLILLPVGLVLWGAVALMVLSLCVVSARADDEERVVERPLFGEPVEQNAGSHAIGASRTEMYVYPGFSSPHGAHRTTSSSSRSSPWPAGC